MVFPEFSAATKTGTGGASAAVPVVMLEGKALLDKARSLSNRPEDQIARACGYVGPSGRLLKKSFYRALILAKGYKLPEGAGGGSGRTAGRSGAGGPLSRGNGKGRQAVFRTRVHGNGNLLIGQAYTKLMGLEPGQEFRIELERETGSILLLPLSEAAELNAATVDEDPAEDDFAPGDFAPGDFAAGGFAAGDVVASDLAASESAAGPAAADADDEAASDEQEYDGFDPLA